MGWQDSWPSDEDLSEFFADENGPFSLRELRQLCHLFRRMAGAGSTVLKPEHLQNFLGYQTRGLAKRLWGLFLAGKGDRKSTKHYLSDTDADDDDASLTYSDIEDDHLLQNKGLQMRDWLLGCCQERHVAAMFQEMLEDVVNNPGNAANWIEEKKLRTSLEDCMEAWCMDTAAQKPGEVQAAIREYCQEYLGFHPASGTTATGLPDLETYLWESVPGYAALASERPEKLRRSLWALSMLDICEHQPTGKERCLALLQDAIEVRCRSMIRAAEGEPGTEVAMVISEGHHIQAQLLEFRACVVPCLPSLWKESLAHESFLYHASMFAEAIHGLRQRYHPSLTSAATGEASQGSHAVEGPPLSASEAMQVLDFGEGVGELLHDCGLEWGEQEMSILANELGELAEEYVEGQRKAMMTACRNALIDDVRWPVQYVRPVTSTGPGSPGTSVWGREVPSGTGPVDPVPGGWFQSLGPRMVFEVLETELDAVMTITSRSSRCRDLIRGVCQAIMDQMVDVQAVLAGQVGPDSEFERLAATANNCDLCYDRSHRLLMIMGPLVEGSESADSEDRVATPSSTTTTSNTTVTTPASWDALHEIFVDPAKKAVSVMADLEVAEEEFSDILSSLLSVEWAEGRVTESLLDRAGWSLDQVHGMLRPRSYCLYAAALLDHITLRYCQTLFDSKCTLNHKVRDQWEADEAGLKHNFLPHFAEGDASDRDGEQPWSPNRAAWSLWAGSPRAEGDLAASLARMSRLRSLLHAETPVAFAEACKVVREQEPKLSCSQLACLRLLKRRDDILDEERTAWKAVVERLSWSAAGGSQASPVGGRSEALAGSKHKSVKARLAKKYKKFVAKLSSKLPSSM